ncbi:MAG: hypothetical protein CM1200mP3_17200 [Chloroflexota bacterium]|nr:MAG: hypothetical protein CM1200mP3_17200 [Chloroflexota bacterium]
MSRFFLESIVNVKPGDVFGSNRCDCGDQVDLALEAIEKEGKGVLLYMGRKVEGLVYIIS